MIAQIVTKLEVDFTLLVVPIECNANILCLCVTVVGLDAVPSQTV